MLWFSFFPHPDKHRDQSPSQCVSIRDIIKQDHLSRRILNILARCVHQGRPHPVTAPCTCKGHLVYLLGGVTSLWGETGNSSDYLTVSDLILDLIQGAIMEKKQEEVIKKRKFVYSACFLQTQMWHILRSLK